MTLLQAAKRQSRFRKFLVVLNVSLAIIFVSLLAYWFGDLRPRQIAKAKEISHYFAYHIDNLPLLDNQIEPDYVGNIDSVKHQQMVNFDIKTMTSTIDEIDFSMGTKSNIDVISAADAQIAKADQLIGVSSNIKPTKASSPKEVIITTQPKIAIILTDLGLTRKTTELALSLPKECALGFLPQTKNLKPLLYKAKSNGHEIFMCLPMEQSSESSVASKFELSDKFAIEENIARMAIVLNSHSSYNGVYSSYKEAFTNNYANAKLIIQQLEVRGLPLLYGRNANSEISPLLDEYKDVKPATIVIDEELDEVAILAKLNSLLDEANAKGSAIGYGQGYPLTIKILQKWLPSLDEAGIKLVPLTRIIKDN